MTILPQNNRARRLLTGVLALGGCFVILTSGPRSLQGRTAETVEPAPPEATTTAEASTTVSLPGSIDDPPEVLWQTLMGLDYRSGEVSEELLGFVGKEVKIPGFMVPLEDFAEQVTEFLLVPYVGACVHTPPPPPNQLVYVVMAEGERVPVSFWDPVWIHGTLEIEETTNMYTNVSFKLTGTEITPYEF